MRNDTGNVSWWKISTRILLCAILIWAVYYFLPFFPSPSLSFSELLLLQGAPLAIAVGLATRGGYLYMPFLAFTGGVSFFWSSLTHDSLSPSLAGSLGLLIAVEIFLLSYLFRRTGAYLLQYPKHVAWMLGISVGIVVPVAVVGSLLLLSGSVIQDYTGDVVRSWMVDDLFGVFLFVPALLLLRRPKFFDVDKITEYGLAVLLSLLASGYLFNIVQPGQPGLFGWPYVILVGPLWIAVRMGAAAVAPVNVLVFGFATYSTYAGRGPFTVASPYLLDRIAAVETFSIIMSITLLTIAVLRDSRLVSERKEKTAAQLVRSVVDASTAPIFAKSYREEENKEGTYILVNTAWETVVGKTREETLGRTDEEVFPETSSGKEIDERILSRKHPVTLDIDFLGRVNSTDGSGKIFQTVKFPLSDENGESWGVGGITYDITDVTRVKEEALRQAEKLRVVFLSSPVPTARVKVENENVFVIAEINDAMSRLLGFATKNSRNLKDYVAAEDWTLCETLMLSAVAGLFSEKNMLPQREIRLSKKEMSSTIYVLMSVAAIESEEKDYSEIILQFMDVTAQHALLLRKEEKALRDSLTGVYTFPVFTNRLEEVLKNLKGTQHLAGVFICDVDGLTTINDALGFSEGDKALTEIGARLLSALRPSDLVSRMNGDEFIVLCEGLTRSSDAYLIASRIQDYLQSPWKTETFEGLLPTVSVGATIVDTSEMSVREIVRRADLAMYRAKSKGKGRIEIYSEEVDEEIREASRIRSQIYDALQQKKLTLQYQPIVRLSDETVFGVEALVRMRNTDGTLVPPNVFLPQAELSSQIIPIGAWVLKQAVSDFCEWRRKYQELTLTMNVSAAQLRRSGYAQTVFSTLMKEDVPFSCVQIDVTEKVFLKESEKTVSELRLLADAGVRIAVDDFSLNMDMLTDERNIFLSAVKVDRGMTSLVGVKEDVTTKFANLICYAKEKGFSVVAEGVETEEQRSMLMEHGCVLGQGYLFGLPTLVDGIPAALSEDTV